MAICLPLLKVPLYTRPNPPSPMMQAADQSWLAISNSLYVKYLQLSGCTCDLAVLYCCTGSGGMPCNSAQTDRGHCMNHTLLIILSIRLL